MTSLSTCNAKVATLTTQLNAANATIASLQTQLATANTTIITRDATIVTLTATLATRTQERDALQARLDALVPPVITPPPVIPPVITPPPVPSADFDARKTAPGVVRYFDFDSPAQLGSLVYGSNFGVDKGDQTTPVLDAAVKANGLSSLRFDIPPQSSSNAAGSFHANFSADLLTQFGENTEFYVQWTQRFNQAMVDTGFLAASGGPQEGIKQIIIGTGDQPQPWNMSLSSSCSDLEVASSTYYSARVPRLYNQCGKYAGLTENVPPYDYLFQNALPACLYSDVKAGRTGACFTWVADEWLTFQIGITLGPRDNATNTFSNSTVRFWAAREGKPSVLLVDWKPGVNGYFPLYAGPAAQNQKFGKVWLLPYMTNKDPSQVNPLAQTWIDGMIISTKRVDDPLSAPMVVPPAPVPVPPTGTYPAWRSGKPVGAFFEIANTASMNGYQWPAPMPTTSGIIDTWNGLAAGPSSLWSVAGGGHGEWPNAALKIELNTDAPKWALVNPGSAFADTTMGSPYYGDGLPVSRHTYDQSQFISAAQSRDGIDRVMLFSVCAAYGTGTVGGFEGGPQVDGFRVSDGKYDAEGTWASMPNFEIFASTAKHPLTGDVYSTNGYRCRKWTAKTGLWSVIVDQSTTSPPVLFAWDQLPSCVDAKRNRLVGVIDRRPYPPDLRMVLVDLTTYAVTPLSITGALTAISTGMVLVHDEDADRYLLFMNGPVYAIDPSTGVSTLLVTLPAPLYAAGGKAAYFKALGGVAYLPRFSSNVLFMPTR